jgi:hypothetical protein
MALILIFNARLAKLAQHAEEEDLTAADERLSLMMQIITGIKAIKLSAWEDSFMKLMLKCRTTEMDKLRRYRTLHQSTVQLGRACPVLCAGVSFIYLAAMNDGDLQASDMFAALNVFLSLRLPLIVIPEGVTYVGGYIVSFRRIEGYLALDEVSNTAESNSPEADVAGASGSGSALMGSGASAPVASAALAFLDEPDEPDEADEPGPSRAALAATLLAASAAAIWASENARNVSELCVTQSQPLAQHWPPAQSRQLALRRTVSSGGGEVAARMP